MAARKKAKKALGKGTRARGTTRRAPSAKQALRRKIQRRVDARLAEAMKRARALEAQGLAPGEIAERVKAELDAIGGDVAADVLRLAGGSIHINMEK